MKEIPFSELDALFLDAGNTLVSIDHELMAEHLAELGTSCSADTIRRAEAGARPDVSRRITGGDSTEWADTFAFYLDRILASALDLEGEERRELASRWARRLHSPEVRTDLWARSIPGVAERLESLRAVDLQLVVISNSDGTIEQVMERVGLRRFLHHIVDSTLVGFEKPDPRIFQHALEKIQVDPGRVLHVGDLYGADVVGARAAGLHALLLDPYDDWADVDCARRPNFVSLADELLAARS